MDFGIATVAAITALVYIIGLGVKASNLDNKWIPVIAGVPVLSWGLWPCMPVYLTSRQPTL